LDGFFNNNRGLAYADLKQFEKAIQDYNQAIKLNPKNARAFNNRGNTYTKKPLYFCIAFLGLCNSLCKFFF
jgi:tetratricopeptide (TPR) repeat protein